MNVIDRTTTVLHVLAGILLLAGWPGLATVSANVFGDGNPDNGIEDDRRSLVARGRPGEALESWQMSAGTIFCDERVRGTAVLLDVSDFSDTVKGSFLATSAHVLYDLERGEPFETCQFHYLALDRIPGYQLPINRNETIRGAFDPELETSEAGFGREDWAFLFVGGSWPYGERAGKLRLRAYDELPHTLQFDLPGAAGQPVGYRFIGFDPSREVIAVGDACQVITSSSIDLGGGAWAGQLLDDCDSGDGASGGAIIARHDGEYFMVGIRTGSHWSRGRYPPGSFPTGPPPGSRWNVHLNTNFGRAIDSELIRKLRELVNRVAQRQIAPD